MHEDWLHGSPDVDQHNEASGQRVSQENRIEGGINVDIVVHQSNQSNAYAEQRIKLAMDAALAGFPRLVYREKTIPEGYENWTEFIQSCSIYGCIEASLMLKIHCNKSGISGGGSMTSLQKISHCDLRLPLWCKHQLEEKTDWCILDTETTGKDPSKAELVEIAIIDSLGKTLLSMRVKPMYSIPVEAQRIHHITNSDVISAPTFLEAWPIIMAQLVGKRVVTYNAAFDSGILMRTSDLYGIRFPSLQWHCMMVDYAEWYGKPGIYRNRPGWQKLSEACQQQGARHGQLHSALGDCQSTWFLMRALADRGDEAPTWRRVVEARGIQRGGGVEIAPSIDEPSDPRDDAKRSSEKSVSRWNTDLMGRTGISTIDGIMKAAGADLVGDEDG